MINKIVVQGVIVRAMRKKLLVVLCVGLLIMAFSSTAVAASPVNLVQNPSLENSVVSGVPDNWQMGGWGNNTTLLNYPVTGHTGVGASVTVTNYVDGDAKWYFDSVPVIAGTQYVFSDYYNSNVQSELDAAFTMADGTITYMYLASLTSTEGTWQQSIQSFTPPLNSKSVTLFHLIAGNGILSIDDYSLTQDVVSTNIGGFSKGMVTLSFDDGWTSHYDNALPVLQTHGLKGTFYIITQPMLNADAAGGADQYMNSKQVVAMRASGNEIGVHTVNHCDLVTLLCPDADIPNSKDTLTRQQEITKSRSTLQAAGISLVDTLAYPYGAYNKKVKTVLVNNSYAGGRSGDQGFNSTTSDKYALKVQNLDASTTLDQIKPWIDTALENHYWLILTFHQVENSLAPAETYGVTTQLLSDVADYLNQQQASVVTVHDGLLQMKP